MMPGFGALPLPDQYARTRDALNELHPGHGADLINPVAVSWQNVPFNLGPWVDWPEGPNADYRLLNQGEGRVYLAGEHLSHISGWQEGAVLSAHRVVSAINDRERAAQA
jgi:monoamine oxidase